MVITLNSNFFCKVATQEIYWLLKKQSEHIKVLSIFVYTAKGRMLTEKKELIIIEENQNIDKADLHLKWYIRESFLKLEEIFYDSK